MRIDFHKMEGAGNDFVLVDNRDSRIPDSVKVSMVVKACRRALGIGADGMIFLENDPEFDFAWDFYNADGSKAEMCGNGARCVARYAHAIGAAGNTMTFRSLAGPIDAELTERGAKVRLTDATLPQTAENISIDGKTYQVWFLNTGVPHAVLAVQNLEDVNVRELGRALRYHEHFSPAGTNVNFFLPEEGNRLSIRTYERGVEDETLACGTGSVATSIVAGLFFDKSSPVIAKTRSGEELVVHFTLHDGTATAVYLEGGARTVFTGTFESE